MERGCSLKMSKDLKIGTYFSGLIYMKIMKLCDLHGRAESIRKRCNKLTADADSVKHQSSYAHPYYPERELMPLAFRRATMYAHCYAGR